MNEELQQAVETGSITTETARNLEALAPGAYCRHKSWGFGKVAEWSLITGQIVIDFEGKSGHSMQAAYAVESLTVYAPEHIHARVRTDLEAVKTQASEDPVGLLRGILENFGGKATVDQIQSGLVPLVFDAAGFKKWWDSTKKKLKSDGHFQLPAKKSEPVVLLAEPKAAHTGLLEKFRSARHLKDRVSALDQLMKELSDFQSEVAELQTLAAQIEEEAGKGQRLQPSKALELLLARDEILSRHDALKTGDNALRVADILRESIDLPQLFTEIPAAKHRIVMDSFEEAFGERWSVKAIYLMQQSPARLVNDVYKLFAKKGQEGELRAALEKSIADRSISSEVLLWMCKERGGPFPELFNAPLFVAVLSALEMDQLSEKKSSRLRDSLLDDKTLLSDFFAKAPLEEVRDAMRRVLITTVFDDLSRRSLLGRIIKLHPELQSMVSGDRQEAEVESLTVSWPSLERRKRELDELVNVKIPQNVRDIQIARSYGDLRENFEFKSAKEQQAVLARQKSELEQMLINARGTNFDQIDTSVVSIGTTVTLSTPQGEEVFSILGAWDSSPENGIISYKAALAQSLLGHHVGDEVELQSEGATRRVRIEKIEAFTNHELIKQLAEATTGPAA